MTQPISPPTKTNDAILGPIIQPTPRSAGEVATPPYNTASLLPSPMLNLPRLTMPCIFP